MISSIGGFFKSKRRLRAYFIDEAGLLIIREIKYDNNSFTTKFNGNLHAYIIDHNFIFYSAKDKTPCSFYYVNNPHPVHIQHERNIDVDSIGFKQILDSKTITDLFSNEGKNLLLMLTIMVGACIVLGLIMIAIQAGWITLPKVASAAASAAK